MTLSSSSRVREELQSLQKQKSIKLTTQCKKLLRLSLSCWLISKWIVPSSIFRTNKCEI